MRDAMPIRRGELTAFLRKVACVIWVSCGMFNTEIEAQAEPAASNDETELRFPKDEAIGFLFTRPITPPGTPEDKEEPWKRLVPFQRK